MVEQAPNFPLRSESNEDVKTASGPKLKVLLLMVGTISAIVIAAGGGFWVGLQQGKQLPAQPNSSASPIGGVVACTMEAKICPDGSSVGRTGPNCEFSPCPSLAPAGTTPTNSLSKRLFNPVNSWYQTEPYPTEISTVAETDLVGLTCTPRYDRSADGVTFIYNRPNSSMEYSPEPLADTTILAEVAKITKRLDFKQIDGVQDCALETGGHILITHKESGGGGGGNTTYLSDYGTAYPTDSILTIRNPGLAYFICTDPLQLTKSGRFFMQCNGGDGGGGGSVIAWADFTLGQADILRFCTSTVDQPIPVCR